MNDNEEIIKLYQEGLTLKEIADLKKMAPKTIGKILKNAKISFRKRYLSDFNDSEVQEVILKYKNNKNIKELAKEHNISAPAISRLLKSKNIEVKFIGRQYDILRQTPINKKQQELIVGSVLGDGCLYREGKGLYKLSFGHCEKQKEYFLWKYAMLDPFVNTYRKSIDKRGNSIMYQTTTICHKDFAKFAEMFYDKNRKKHIPDNLDMYLTPLSLCTWYLDDGSLNEGVNARIHTLCFDYNDNVKLQNYLVRCFDLRSKIWKRTYKNKEYYGLSLNKKNTQKLSDIIRPYVVDCMKYKIMPEILEPSTTICLTENKISDDRV